MRYTSFIIILFLIGVAGHAELYGGQLLNGFDLSNSIISSKEIIRGGPPKDGIPAIDEPNFILPSENTRLQDNDQVLGVFNNGIAKAYPISIMNWHEIVNDSYGADPVVITFCPLCGSGMAFTASANGINLRFGVSGLLYNSDVLLYDRRSNSLWSQILGQGVTGEYKGTILQQIPVEHTTWQQWRDHYPDTQILSFTTGFSRDYQQNPYAGYSINPETYFPVKFKARGLHPKEMVLAINLDGKSKAYPFVELAKGGVVVDDLIGDIEVSISYFPEHNSAIMTNKQGEKLPAITLFWFAWAAFHPDTAIYRTKSPSQ